VVHLPPHFVWTAAGHSRTVARIDPVVLLRTVQYEAKKRFNIGVCV
jgi:hypothetical protein